MKLKYTRLYIFFFVIIIEGCSKNIIIPNPELEKLFGTWEWIQSSGGFAGKTTTPVTTKIVKRIEFSKNGTYKSYENNILKDRRYFSISAGESIFSKKQAYILQYSDPSSKKEFGIKQSIIINKDSLFLNDECYDCFKNIYIKK
jgi:hypothetical protein